MCDMQVSISWCQPGRRKFLLNWGLGRTVGPYSRLLVILEDASFYLVPMKEGFPKKFCPSDLGRAQKMACYLTHLKLLGLRTKSIVERKFFQQHS
jgi:hypothetical protein